MGTNDDDYTETWTLSKESEFRFEIEDGVTCKIKLTSGKAELFGTELAVDREYVFTGTKAGIFTWHGCTIKSSGEFENAYVSDNVTCMREYINLHQAMVQKRQADEPVRVLVMGAEEVGKSTLCRILLNYSVRSGSSPIYVDLDVDLNDISLPGSVGCVVVDKPVDIESGYDLSSPLVYHFGKSRAHDNVKLYKRCISQLGETIDKRMMVDEKIKQSGLIVNTMSYDNSSEMKEILSHTVDTLKINVICVVDNERLYNSLKRKHKENKVVIRLSKSGGVVNRTLQGKQNERKRRVKEYFYGTHGQLYPHSLFVRFADVKYVKIGVPNVPLACLPIGETVQDYNLKIIDIEAGPDIKHNLCGVVGTDDSTNDDAIINSSLRGFVYVTTVDEKRKEMTILSPYPGQLPNKILVKNDLLVQLE